MSLPLTPQQIADLLDAQHLARFAPVSAFDAPTFAPADVARVCGINADTVTYHARRAPGFPAPIEPNGWHLTWKKAQWPAVLLSLLAACPKARKGLAAKMGLSLSKGISAVVSEVLRNPFKASLSPA